MTDSRPLTPRGGFFADLRSLRTYLNALYLLLAFPLGLVAFLLLVVGVSVGFGLSVVWIGIPMLLLVLAAALGLADVERALAASLLGARVRRTPKRLREANVWGWVKLQLGDASTWKALAFLLLKFPLGLATFLLVLVPGVLSLGLIAAPILALTGLPLMMSFGEPRALSLFGTLMMPVAGVGLAVFTAALVNALGSLWSALSVALLADPGETRRAQREVQALSRTASLIAFAGTLEETLHALLGQALDATGATGLVVVTLEDGVADGNADEEERAPASRGLPDGFSSALERVYRAHPDLAAPLDLREGRLQIARRMRGEWRHDPRLADLQTRLPTAGYDTLVSLPLTYRASLVGRLDVFFAADTEPSRRELDFLSAVADQAAVAVENARLFARYQQQAGLEERQRIARELHDSVAQALYGVTLGLRTARVWLDRDPERAKEPLDYALSLAEGGTAEMKALLFALRPEALAEEGLVAALQKHAAALSARYKLSVETHFGPEPQVPLAVKQGLYRIAQEAMHNVVKHARARHVELRLAQAAGFVELAVRDDGQGFDAGASFPGHLGLRSMRERAERLGGTLSIEAAPGAGAALTATVPVVASRLVVGGS